MSITGALPEVGELSSTADPKIRTLLSELKTAVGEQEAVQHSVKWYEPKIIATEQTTTSTTFTTLSTADEIPGVVVPEGGKLIIAYRAKVKSSVANAGRLGLFIGNNPLRTVPNAQNVEISASGSGNWLVCSTDTGGVVGFSGEASEVVDSTTGQIISAGSLEIFLPAGTYRVSAQFKATSGSVSAKERRLWVEVHGV